MDSLSRREVVRLAKRVFVFGGSSIGGWDPDLVKAWIVEGGWSDRPEALDDAALAEIMREAARQSERVERFLGLCEGRS